MAESGRSPSSFPSEDVNRQRTEAHVRQAEQDLLKSEQDDYACTGNVSSPFSFQRRMDNVASDAMRAEGYGDPDKSSPSIIKQQQQVRDEVVTKALDEIGTDDSAISTVDSLRP